jgi:hypothetical protein
LRREPTLSKEISEMNEHTPTPSDDKIARRNYVLFCGAAALVLFIIVFISVLLISG